MIFCSSTSFLTTIIIQQLLIQAVGVFAIVRNPGCCCTLEGSVISKVYKSSFFPNNPCSN